MVKETVSSIDISIAESNDSTHRYSIKKVWDVENPLVTVLTLYPTSSNYIENDLTNYLITRNVYRLGYGGYYCTNLFSEKLVDKSKYQYATDNVNDEIIINCIEQSEIVILAHGSMAKKNKRVKERLNEVLTLLESKGLSHKVRQLTDLRKADCFHPLSVKVRKHWEII